MLTPLIGAAVWATVVIFGYLVSAMLGTHVLGTIGVVVFVFFVVGMILAINV